MKKNFRPRPIDIYKKLPLVRQEDLVFEDENGQMQRISKNDAQDIAVRAAPCPRP
jgi:hypothetical protein